MKKTVGDVATIVDFVLAMISCLRSKLHVENNNFGRKIFFGMHDLDSESDSESDGEILIPILI